MIAKKPIKTPLLHYQQMGKGEHIVLIHGLFGSLENLNMVAKPLSKSYCVTSIDVRNHGHSFHENNMDYSILALDVIKLMDELSIDQFYLLGHSMGGKIAIQLALEYPKRVKKLLIADIAPVSYPPHHIEIIKGLQAIDLSKVHKRQDADEQLANYVDDLSIRQFLLRNLSQNKAGQFSFKCNLTYIANCYSHVMKANQVTQNNENKPIQFMGETLFIKGGASNYILAEHKEAIAKILPNSKAKIIQGAGHWLHAEKTSLFNKIVTTFLKE